ncbi:hypothetical protein, partial [Lactobacillus helveticus]|uniref:hypothetical protein n=2 Tax=Lactobacillus helveticus TaxID=1587 RepID=UPI001C2540DA
NLRERFIYTKDLTVSKKIIKPFLIGVIGIWIGIFSTIFWTKHQPQKPINFSITNKNVSYLAINCHKSE